MFENFSKFFAEKKNTHIFIAALVILGGIFTLKSVGLYEGLENQGWSLDDSETFVTGPLDVEFVPENYVKKPVVIQAVKFTGVNEEELRLFCGDALGAIVNNEAHIRTLEDGRLSQVEHMATVGDYIIKGIKGEFYACKPDIFEASYESTWQEYKQQ